MTTLGSGDFVYQELTDWARFPDGWGSKEVVDVVVDAQDRVYAFDRGDHPLTVFEADGTLVTSWGEGSFTRPHGVTIRDEAGHGEVIYCVDDDGHWIGKFTPAGELLMSIGRRDEPAPAQSGRPFNRPTKVAFDPKTDDLYITDGYGNARVHKYSTEGEHLFSWGDYGTDPGQFNLPHSVCTDPQGRVYIADRENHRIQIFDDQGNYLEQWNNLHRPCGLHIKDDLVYIGQLKTEQAVNSDYPNIGAWVTIHDLSGRCLARLGDIRPGEGPGQFIAPHGLSVDFHGDIYVGEVSWTILGKTRPVRSFRKLVKV